MTPAPAPRILNMAGEAFPRHDSGLHITKLIKCTCILTQGDYQNHTHTHLTCQDGQSRGNKHPGAWRRQFANEVNTTGQRRCADETLCSGKHRRQPMATQICETHRISSHNNTFPSKKSRHAHCGSFCSHANISPLRSDRSRLVKDRRAASGGHGSVGQMRSAGHNSSSLLNLHISRRLTQCERRRAGCEISMITFSVPLINNV